MTIAPSVSSGHSFDSEGNRNNRRHRGRFGLHQNHMRQALKSWLSEKALIIAGDLPPTCAFSFLELAHCFHSALVQAILLDDLPVVQHIKLLSGIRSGIEH